MRRSMVVYVPLFFFLPLLTLLYVLTEISLDAAKQGKARRELVSDFAPAMPRPRLSYTIRPRPMKNSRIYRHIANRQGFFPAKPGGQGEGRPGSDEVKVSGGKGEKDRGGNIMFPPFVEEVNAVGAGGRAVRINQSKLTEEEKTRYSIGWSRNSFSQFVSDMISIHRPLPHGWSSYCRNKTFRSDLPEVAVIIIFHNEAWTVLLRTVHSVLSRTPSHLLREVILVDDFSSMDHLKEPLDEYWRRTDGRVKVVHAKERVGLTQARLLGFEVSTAPMLVFFDSHIECFPGWFEPLADRIATDPNVTVFPSIEVIDAYTFRVGANHNVDTLGYFRWRDLTFQWAALTEEHKATRKSPADPIKSPTMPGGLFAIGRKFFTQLGTYDPGLQYWGGENIEISFKAWMCYGSVELVPCSHVGHIFRGSNPIKWKTDVGLNNVARVAYVWMDDYKNYFLERNLFKLGDFGDVSERQKLRQKMGCRDFGWYVKNVHPVQFAPLHVQHAGELKMNLSGSYQCIDSFRGHPEGTPPKLVGCHGLGGNQFWHISDEGELFQDLRKICDKNGTIVLSKACHDKWKITETKQLLHVATGRCLHGGGLVPDKAGHTDPTLLTLQPCDGDNVRQRWETRPRDKTLNFPAF